MCCSLVLLLSCSLFMICFKQALYILQPWGRALVALGNVQTLPPLISYVSSSSSAAGAASLCSFEATLFLFHVLSTYSPCTEAFTTLVRVGGEDLRH